MVVSIGTSGSVTPLKWRRKSTYPVSKLSETYGFGKKRLKKGENGFETNTMFLMSHGAITASAQQAVRTAGCIQGCRRFQLTSRTATTPYTTAMPSVYLIAYANPASPPRRTRT